MTRLDQWDQSVAQRGSLVNLRGADLGKNGMGDLKGVGMGEEDVDNKKK